MIETDYFILGSQEFVQAKQDADQLGVNVDYYLMEFCSIEGDWVEISD